MYSSILWARRRRRHLTTVVLMLNRRTLPWTKFRPQTHSNPACQIRPFLVNTSTTHGLLRMDSATGSADPLWSCGLRQGELNMFLGFVESAGPQGQFVDLPPNLTISRASSQHSPHSSRRSFPISSGTVKMTLDRDRQSKPQRGRHYAMGSLWS